MIKKQDYCPFANWTSLIKPAVGYLTAKLDRFINKGRKEILYNKMV
jgi:hypothetical protein